MMKAYEEVSLWVATEILTQDKARRRVKLIKKFIDIAKVRSPTHIRDGMCDRSERAKADGWHNTAVFEAAQQLPQLVRGAGGPQPAAGPVAQPRLFRNPPPDPKRTPRQPSFFFAFVFASFFDSHNNAVVQVFSDLVKLIPPREGEALAYKESLQKSVDEGHLPLLPYLGASFVLIARFPAKMMSACTHAWGLCNAITDVVLRDILLIEDGIPSRTKVHNLINFEKRARLFSVIQKVRVLSPHPICWANSKRADRACRGVCRCTSTSDGCTTCSRCIRCG